MEKDFASTTAGTWVESESLPLPNIMNAAVTMFREHGNICAYELT